METNKAAGLTEVMKGSADMMQIKPIVTALSTQGFFISDDAHTFTNVFPSPVLEELFMARYCALNSDYEYPSIYSRFQICVVSLPFESSEKSRSQSRNVRSQRKGFPAFREKCEGLLIQLFCGEEDKRDIRQAMDQEGYLIVVCMMEEPIYPRFSCFLPVSVLVCKLIPSVGCWVSWLGTSNERRKIRLKKDGNTDKDPSWTNCGLASFCVSLSQHLFIAIHHPRGHTPTLWTEAGFDAWKFWKDKHRFVAAKTVPEKLEKLIDQEDNPLNFLGSSKKKFANNVHSQRIDPNGWKQQRGKNGFDPVLCSSDFFIRAVPIPWMDEHDDQVLMAHRLYPIFLDHHNSNEMGYNFIFEDCKEEKGFFHKFQLPVKELKARADAVDIATFIFNRIPSWILERGKQQPETHAIQISSKSKLKLVTPKEKGGMGRVISNENFCRSSLFFCLSYMLFRGKIRHGDIRRQLSHMYKRVSFCYPTIS